MIDPGYLTACEINILSLLTKRNLKIISTDFYNWIVDGQCMICNERLLVKNTFYITSKAKALKVREHAREHLKKLKLFL